MTQFSLIVSVSVLKTGPWTGLQKTRF